MVGVVAIWLELWCVDENVFRPRDDVGIDMGMTDDEDDITDSEANEAKEDSIP